MAKNDIMGRLCFNKCQKVVIFHFWGKNVVFEKSENEFLKFKDFAHDCFVPLPYYCVKISRQSDEK